MIDQCHRGGDPKFYKDNNKHWVIDAAMHRWKDCKNFIREARKKKSVLVDYKYGPITTVRWNIALKKRREIIDSKLMTKARVAALWARVQVMLNINLLKTFLELK